MNWRGRIDDVLWRECQAEQTTRRTQVVGGVLKAETDALFDEFGYQFCPQAPEKPAINRLEESEDGEQVQGGGVTKRTGMVDVQGQLG